MSSTQFIREAKRLTEKEVIKKIFKKNMNKINRDVTIPPKTPTRDKSKSAVNQKIGSKIVNFAFESAVFRFSSGM